MSFNTLFLAAVVLAFGSLMVTLMWVSVWSNQKPRAKTRRAEATPARRPEPADRVTGHETIAAGR